MRHPLLIEIDNTEQWIIPGEDPLACTQCQDFMQSDYFRFSDGRILCISCVIHELQEKASEILLHSMHTRDIEKEIDTLKKHKNISALLPSLISLPQRIDAYDPEDGKAPLLLQNIVSLMGHTEHPLSPFIRQNAFNLSETIGKAVLPYCRTHFGTPVWQFYCNTLMTAGIIAPADKEVQEELEKAWTHENEEIKTFIQGVFKKESFGIYHKSINTKTLETLKTINMKFKTIQENRTYFLDTADLQELQDIILEKYDLTRLKSLFDNYLSRLFNTSDREASSGRKKKITKREMAGMLTVTLKTKELFDSFFLLLPKDVREIFRTLVWRNQKLDLNGLEKKYKRKILIKEKGNRYGSREKIIDDYSVFQYHEEWDYRNGDYNYYIYIDARIRRTVKGFFPPPEWSVLNFLETFESSNIFKDERAFLEGVELMIQYIGHNPVSCTATGKISAKYIRDFNKRCEIEEFFVSPTQKTLQFIRTEMLIRILNDIDNIEFTEPHEIIKEIYGKTIKSDDFNMFIVGTFLSYLKFDRMDYKYYYEKENRRFSKNIRKIMTNVLKNLEEDKWLALTNIFLSMDYHEQLFYIFPLQEYKNMFHFNETYTDYYEQREKIYISEENYVETVFIPFFKAFFHFLAALGIVDMAGTEPHNDSFHQNKLDYLSRYDGLEAVRLTPLGSYVLGMSPKAPEAPADEDPFQIRLDDQFLLIQTKGSDRVKEFIINDIAEKIKPGNYLVTFDSFLTNCKGLRDVKDKIAVFREKLEKNPPDRFELFFREILARFNPMEEKNGYALYKIKNDPLLIKLITEDPYLKKSILRAEDFHILIKEDKLKQVKQKLVKSGFYIS
ncbi:MAG TPA: hypothetical protein DCO79_00130 [Spirochaeta sp.]|nr:hypothetical protein [Spirochaeta sp.]